MRRIPITIAAGASMLAAAAAGPASGGLPASGAGTPAFSRPGAIDNPYLPLAKYRSCVLRGHEDGARVRVVRRLLERRRRFEVGGRAVAAAIIEDRAIEDGQLVERTLDYFAQADGGTVYYLGEHVDNYEDGRVVDHGGSWLYGRDTDRLGVAMPARPRVGDRWRFEDVPGITVESDRVVRRIARVTVAGRAFRDVIRVREHLMPEDAVEYKLYARGVGLLREVPPDGLVELSGCSRRR
jgi:hypothetical protein